jgi:hypothetical protein
VSGGIFKYEPERFRRPAGNTRRRGSSYACAIHFNLQELEWGEMPVQTGQMTVIGNVMRAGPSTGKGLPMIMIGSEGDLDLYADDNISVDRWGRDVPLLGRYTMGRARIVEADRAIGLPEGLKPFQAKDVEHYVLANAGARPWDRDRHDVRVFADVAEGRGEIIDSQEQVGGYPDYTPSVRAFDPSLPLGHGDDETRQSRRARFARKAGLQIPEDLSIVGFDDTPISARIWPPMPTVRSPIRDVGRAAARRLIQVDGGSDAQQPGAFALELIVRDSTQAPHRFR